MQPTLVKLIMPPIDPQWFRQKHDKLFIAYCLFKLFFFDAIFFLINTHMPDIVSNIATFSFLLNSNVF